MDDGLRAALSRGDLISRLPIQGAGAGGMLAVFEPAKNVISAVSEVNANLTGVGLSVAADNGTHQVVSGPFRGLDALSELLVAKGVRVERFNSSHGLYSGLVEPILDDIEEALGGIRSRHPTIALVSGVTGRVVDARMPLDGAYWRRQARDKVAFAEGVVALAALDVDMVVEVGPQSTVCPIAELYGAAGLAGVEDEDQEQAQEPIALAGLLQRPFGVSTPTANEEDAFLEAVAGAYEAGVALKFTGLFAGETRRRISIPTYPFQRKRHWIDRSGRGR